MVIALAGAAADNSDREDTLDMGLGTQVRLRRLFSHPSGRLFGVAVDHFIGYGDVRIGGLRNLPQALEQVMSARPDSVTMLPGSAKQLWPRFAGQSSLIIQAGMFTPDDRVRELIATPEDATRLGADALAVAIGVRGPYEGSYLRWLSDSVAAAAKVEMPVVAHIYPRDYSGEVPVIRFVPEEIAWAVRCGVETGVDVIKVGYPGDLAAFADIVASAPVPVVVAGGPRTETVRDALTFTEEAMKAGAVGAVVGRNLWGVDDIEGVAAAYQAVIHDSATAEEALALVGRRGGT
jgi:fructose-bisphosphate aldolase, class I